MMIGPNIIVTSATTVNAATSGSGYNNGLIGRGTEHVAANTLIHHHNLRHQKPPKSGGGIKRKLKNDMINTTTSTINTNAISTNAKKGHKKSRLHIPAVINGNIIENNSGNIIEAATNNSTHHILNNSLNTNIFHAINTTSSTTNCIIDNTITTIPKIDYRNSDSNCIIEQFQISPQHQQQFGQENCLYNDNQCETKEIENSNLSWLLDFKVASLFDPAEENSNSTRRGSSSEDDPREEKEDLMTTSPRPNKPPYTYTELIEQALKEKGELTVSGIYYWISERFPFYKVHDDRWKNSVRHNLSINPHFRKGMKASQGAGHLWTLSTQGVTPSPDVWKKRGLKSIVNLMDEVAVATASIEEPSEMTAEELSPQPLLPLTDSSPDPSLARSAEEILSGVKKQVEVQYLTADTDFLNNITKDEVVDDTHLVTETTTPYLISELGSEVILTDGLFCDDLNFQCVELTSTSNL